MSSISLAGYQKLYGKDFKTVANLKPQLCGTKCLQATQSWLSVIGGDLRRG